MQHRLFQLMLILLIAVISISGHAAAAASAQNLPASISTYLQSKHPGAENITVQKQNHFGRMVYEVRFNKNVTDENNKTANQEFVELFRLNGDFYTGAYVVEPNAYNVISEAAHDRLQSRYPGYKIMAMRMLDNPNGVGNEYEMEIQVSGKLLNATLNDKGDVISEIEK